MNLRNIVLLTGLVCCWMLSSCYHVQQIPTANLGMNGARATDVVDKTEALSQLTKFTSHQKLTLEIYFSSPQSKQRVEEIITKYLTAPTFSIFYLLYKSGEHTGWYVIKEEETIDEAVDNFSRDQERFFVDQIARLKQDNLNMDNSQKDLLNFFENQLEVLTLKGMLLSGLAIQDDAQSLVEFINTSTLLDVKYRIIF